MLPWLVTTNRITNSMFTLATFLTGIPFAFEQNFDKQWKDFFDIISLWHKTLLYHVVLFGLYTINNYDIHIMLAIWLCCFLHCEVEHLSVKCCGTDCLTIFRSINLNRSPIRVKLKVTLLGWHCGPELETATFSLGWVCAASVHHTSPFQVT